jgi:hypothetical protein
MVSSWRSGDVHLTRHGQQDIGKCMDEYGCSDGACAGFQPPEEQAWEEHEQPVNARDQDGVKKCEGHR